MAAPFPTGMPQAELNGSAVAMNRSETATASDLSLREQYLASNPDQSVQGITSHQLPSPSPSPSPRSSSPSFVLTETSSAEWDGDVGHGRSTSTSKSFETAASSGQVEEGVDTEGIQSPRPISKILLPHQLHDIKEERVKKPRKMSLSKDDKDDKVLKLSPSEIEQLTSQPESLPVLPNVHGDGNVRERPRFSSLPSIENANAPKVQSPSLGASAFSSGSQRPGHGMRAFSTPFVPNRDKWHDRSSRVDPPQQSRHTSSNQRPDRIEPIDFNTSIKLSSGNPRSRVPSSADVAQPAAQEIPLPPLLSTYLQLELSSTRPSPLYIHRSRATDYQFESAKLKFERLLNFLYVPVRLEPALWFGTLSCLDAWLYMFTILPLRFIKAVSILIGWWTTSLGREARFVAQFVYHGLARLWQRRGGRRSSITTSECNGPSLLTPRSPQSAVFPDNITLDTLDKTNGESRPILEHKLRREWTKKHRRTRSVPSTLSAYHKADILQGLLVILSCVLLMQLDASRMYHSIRGQAAMKLYVIYNVLEVGDRLLAAVGQDIFECLVSEETLGRNFDGRSRLLRPLGMFLLSLIYNVTHATVLFYQVITLNVAVNSYSNSLFTLLLSNQFVEIKGTVFKRIEKQNLFQLFCADAVERFQLWLMLIIIGLRNIVEVGGLSIVHNPAVVAAAADAARNATVPLRNSIIPNSFYIFPSWAGEVLSPFLVVLGSEVGVDWIKHCFVGKFNNVKPVIYNRFLDVLAKDYYTNAFVDQNLMKRLGLPVIPLSCLFIRASVQTYHMFLASQFPPPLASTATSVSLGTEATASPATTAAMEHLDVIIRKALGRSAQGEGVIIRPWYSLDTDDLIAFVAMAAFFLAAFLALLACKLVLGMLLLRYSRRRYETISEREAKEKGGLDTKGKRIGGLGIVELDDEKRSLIYADDPDGLRAVRDRERKFKEQSEKGQVTDFESVRRYEMAAKRIW